MVDAEVGRDHLVARGLGGALPLDEARRAAPEAVVGRRGRPAVGPGGRELGPVLPRPVAGRRGAPRPRRPRWRPAGLASASRSRRAGDGEPGDDLGDLGLGGRHGLGPAGQAPGRRSPTGLGGAGRVGGEALGRAGRAELDGVDQGDAARSPQGGEGGGAAGGQVGGEHEHPVAGGGEHARLAQRAEEDVGPAEAAAGDGARTGHEHDPLVPGGVGGEPVGRSPPAKRRFLRPSASASVKPAAQAGPRAAAALSGRGDRRRGEHRGDLGGDPLAGRLGVGLVGVVAEVVAAGAHGRHGGGARAHERVEHDVALVGVELDQALRELDRERRRVADAGGALGRQLPHVERGVHELVGRGGGPDGQAQLPRASRLVRRGRSGPCWR